jgi:hypothetical protein
LQIFLDMPKINVVVIQTHHQEQGDEKHRRHEEHAGQSDQHQRLPPRLLNHDEGDDRHGHVHGPHAQGGRLAGRLVQAGRPEDLGGEEDGGVDAGQLLGQHHHDGDEEGLPQRAVGQHLLQRHLGHELHRLLLLLHLVHLVVDLDRAAQPGQG